MENSGKEADDVAFKLQPIDLAAAGDPAAARHLDINESMETVESMQKDDRSPQR